MHLRFRDILGIDALLTGNRTAPLTADATKDRARRPMKRLLNFGHFCRSTATGRQPPA